MLSCRLISRSESGKGSGRSSTASATENAAVTPPIPNPNGELCARGLSASVHRMAGVRSVEVSIKTGILSVELVPGNTFKMSDLRTRVHENGFRPMEATVTASGKFDGSKFEVLGASESYEVPVPESKTADDPEITFTIPAR